MKFDSNQAWKRASSQVAANRDVLIALSGVFFLLPSLAFSLLLPQPQPDPSLGSAEMMTMAQEYYLRTMPYIVPLLLLQAIGTLSMLTLFTDRDRPTVGESIRRGLAGIIPYLLAQLLVGLSVGLAASLLLAVAVLTGSNAVLAIMIVAAVVGAAYVLIKTSLTSPVIAVEHIRNPLAALRRSWRLTDGNSVRIALFYLLIAIAFLVILSLVLALFGVILALVAPEGVASVIAAIISSTLGAAMSVYFVAILAAVHRQLAGPSPEAAGITFE